MSFLKLYTDSTLTQSRTLTLGAIHGTSVGAQTASGSAISGGTVHGNRIPSITGNHCVAGGNLVWDSHGTDLSAFINNNSDTTWYLTATKTITFFSNRNGMCTGIRVSEGSTNLYFISSGLASDLTHSELVFLNGAGLKPEEQIYFCQFTGNWVGPISGTIWTCDYGGYKNMLQTALHESGTNFNDLWNSRSLVLGDDANPYSGGGYSRSGGGDPNKQNWAEDSDIVVVDALPDESNYGATAVGLVTIFSPTKAQLKRLADVIWGQGFFNFVQNMVENISDLFISLAMVPFAVPTGNTVEVTWWGYTGGGLEPGTGVYLTLASQQWVEFNMGSISLTGGENSSGFASDSVLDYSPYSKLGIYLPFIGYQELDIDECRGNVLTLIYRIDILSGSCLAIIRVNGRDIYQFTGTCSVQIPLTSQDASSMFTNAVSIATAAASAGSTAAVASAGDAFTQERLSSGKLSQAGAEMQNAQHAAMVSNSEGSLASATVQGVMGMKPNYKKSGAISGGTSLFGVKQPYLFLTTPRQSVPENYQHYCGFPSNVTGKLGDFSGYTVVEDIRLNGLVATSSEVEEIYNLLKTGVII